MKVQRVVARGTEAWMACVLVTIIALAKHTSEEQRRFYRFGPNKDLLILGLSVDRAWKYALVVVYCFINSMVRTLQHNILQPWLINNVQDEEKHKPKAIRPFAIEVTCVSTIYAWFDWFIYMNMLLAQVDMVIIEILADMLVSLITTLYYLGAGGAKGEEGVRLVTVFSDGI